MQSQTKAKVKITYRGEVKGVFGKHEVTVDKDRLEGVLTQLGHDDYQVVRWEPLSISAHQLIFKEAKINDARHEFQVVDYGGEFLLRHYIGRNDPIELALGLDTASATTAYNEYIKDRCYPDKLLVDDLALYCGHTYGYKIS